MHFIIFCLVLKKLNNISSYAYFFRKSKVSRQLKIPSIQKSLFFFPLNPYIKSFLLEFSSRKFEQSYLFQMTDRIPPKLLPGEGIGPTEGHHQQVKYLDISCLFTFFCQTNDSISGMMSNSAISSSSTLSSEPVKPQPMSNGLPPTPKVHMGACFSKVRQIFTQICKNQNRESKALKYPHCARIKVRK